MGDPPGAKAPPRSVRQRTGSEMEKVVRCEEREKEEDPLVLGLIGRAFEEEKCRFKSSS